ncbi:MAG: hypothetical protein J6129_03840, partial [Bacteroidaceae bacterium]|nr:hypothetical protein [Bacteroidaceae bacterium]
MKKIIFVLLLLLAGFTGEAYSQAVAKIGDTEYTTLAAACSAAHDGQTIKLLADIEVNSTIHVSNQVFTLDLNGKRITSNKNCGASETFLQIESNTEITITDSSLNQEGVITCANDGGTLFPIVLQYTGKLIVNAGNIVAPVEQENWNSFCAVNVKESATTLIVNGGNLSTTKGYSSSGNIMPYGVIANYGTTIINGGIIKNTSTAGGLSSRGVYNSGTLIVNGGEISAPNGNAIWNLKNKSLSLSSAAKITGGIAGGNTTLDEYMITDNSDLNFIASVTTNKITYNRGSSNTFGTVCLPFVPDSKSTITYYTLKEATDNMLTLEQVDDFVANTPYIYFTEDGTYNVSKSATTTIDANPVAGTASNDSGWSLKGVYKRTSVFASASDVDYDDADANHVVEPN